MNDSQSPHEKFRADPLHFEADLYPTLWSDYADTLSEEEYEVELDAYVRKAGDWYDAHKEYLSKEERQVWHAMFYVLFGPVARDGALDWMMYFIQHYKYHRS